MSGPNSHDQLQQLIARAIGGPEFMTLRIKEASRELLRAVDEAKRDGVIRSLRDLASAEEEAKPARKTKENQQAWVETVEAENRKNRARRPSLIEEAEAQKLLAEAAEAKARAAKTRADADAIRRKAKQEEKDAEAARRIRMEKARVDLEAAVTRLNIQGGGAYADAPTVLSMGGDDSLDAPSVARALTPKPKVVKESTGLGLSEAKEQVSPDVVVKPPLKPAKGKPKAGKRKK